jgi:ABC-type multidrug transport system ATPase subunit
MEAYRPPDGRNQWRHSGPGGRRDTAAGAIEAHSDRALSPPSTVRFAFYPWMWGRANLEVLALRLPIADAMDSVLERVGLVAVARHKGKTYSQGIPQRLGLAAALLHRPRLLLLDEATNGMDPVGIVEFRTLMRDLAHSGSTSCCPAICWSRWNRYDRVAVIDAGRLMGRGTVAEVARATRRIRVVLERRINPGPGLFWIDGRCERKARMAC